MRTPLRRWLAGPDDWSIYLDDLRRHAKACRQATHVQGSFICVPPRYPCIVWSRYEPERRDGVVYRPGRIRGPRVIVHRFGSHRLHPMDHPDGRTLAEHAGFEADGLVLSLSCCLIELLPRGVARVACYPPGALEYRDDGPAGRPAPSKLRGILTAFLGGVQVYEGPARLLYRWGSGASFYRYRERRRKP